MRTITSILGNSQRLDGGAMFGNAPRAVWERWSAPDERHRISLACRAMLVRDNGRNLLFEAGIGAFFDPKLRDRFGVVEEHHVLLEALESAGVPHDRIDVVVLSHLHFDHAGGVLSAWEEGRAPNLLFPNAKFIVSRSAWERAKQPHLRDRASYIPELPALLEASSRLEIIDEAPGATSPTLGTGYRFHFSEGHTPGLMLAEIDVQGTPVVFAGDLIPGVAWVHLPITMGYDRYPERLIDEKSSLINDLAARGGSLFYTHDPRVALSGVEQDAQGRFRAVREVEIAVGWAG